MAAINTVGRRKRSVARVYLQPGGSGLFTINNRERRQFLGDDLLEIKTLQPFDITELSSKNFDIRVNVAGGGANGQAEAIRLAVARALEKHDPELRPVLKKAGLLRVDSRKVERKKYGKPKARKSFQFSKR